tara:strand:- start:1245 stop:1733 length:489 start_codon:yes stop_codon:yes gene_type:complete
MFKIKLLTLSLISIFVLSCAQTSKRNNELDFSIRYIGGEYDGLVLSNMLETHLRGFNIYNQNSDLEIQASIRHSSNIFITNIDNTSDREKISTHLKVKLYNQNLNCYIFEFSDDVSQFYIYALNEKFLSNQKAVAKIKFDNTESLTKKFVNNLIFKEMECNE